MCAFSQGYFIIFMLQLRGNIGFSLGYSWWLLRSNTCATSLAISSSSQLFRHFLNCSFSFSAKDIFDTTCPKDQLLPFNRFHEILLNRLSRTQLMKSTWINSNV
ncbi:hypothetical protein P3S67_013079 [Capsicum chacoense]